MSVTIPCGQYYKEFMMVTYYSGIVNVHNFLVSLTQEAEFSLESLYKICHFNTHVLLETS